MRDASPSRLRLALVALVFPIFAILAAAQTIAIIGEDSRPDKAVAIAPWDGSVRAHVAKAAYQGQLAENPGTVAPPPERVRRLALEAYARQPLVPGALAVLGAAQPRSESAAFWDAAAKISRRDTLLQGILLKHALQSDDLDRAIHVLNQILLVRVEQRPAAYIALTQALRDPRSIDTFVQILDSGPDWGGGFLIAAARDKESVHNLGIVRQGLRNEVVDPATDRRLVHAFAKAGELNLAYELYGRLLAERTEGSNGWSSEIPPFDWTLADEPGFRAQVIGNDEELQLTIARGKGGVFAKRIVPAGSRSIEIRGAHELRPQQQADRLEIVVTCVGHGTPVARTNLSRGTIALDATLPRDCAFVEISLSGRAWSDGRRITGSITPITILPGG